MPERRVLVFGEDPNDTKSIVRLVQCLRPDLVTKARRHPIILDRGADPGKRKRNFSDVAKVVLAERRPVHAIVLHRDCDEIEPAHIAESQRIEKEAQAALSHSKPKVVAATPAFELETWWYLFPDAVAAYRPMWRRLKRNGQDVGRISRAKEALRRDLRPGASTKVRDYTESDAPEIAKIVAGLGSCSTPSAKSNSYDMFVQKLLKL